MQETELNDALSRMRLQLLKEGHFSQAPAQQRDSQGGVQQQGSWAAALQAPSSATIGWLADGGSSLPGAAGPRTLAPQQSAGSPQSWSGAAASPATAAASTPEGADQAFAAWGGGLFANDPQKIWSGGELATTMAREPSLGQLGLLARPAALLDPC
jgi:hypothetical protein